MRERNTMRILVQQLNECKIILPEMDNQGKPLVKQQSDLKKDLLDAFGGFTVTAGKGVWSDENDLPMRDNVKIYTIAAGFHTNVDMHGVKLPKTAKGTHKNAAPTNDYLRELARKYCVEANQEAIYIKVRGGNVEIIGISG